MAGAFYDGRGSEKILPQPYAGKPAGCNLWFPPQAAFFPARNSSKLTGVGPERPCRAHNAIR